MSVEQITFSFTGDSADAASTTIVGDIAEGLSRFVWFDVVATLIGGTAGTVDVYLQRYSVELTEWIDWLHFPQVALGVTARYVVAAAQPSGLIHAVGMNLTPALAANTAVGGHPGDRLRMVVTAGAGESAGATQLVELRCWKGHT